MSSLRQILIIGVALGFLFGALGIVSLSAFMN